MSLGINRNTHTPSTKQTQGAQQAGGPRAKAPAQGTEGQVAANDEVKPVKDVATISSAQAIGSATTIALFGPVVGTGLLAGTDAVKAMIDAVAVLPKAEREESAIQKMAEQVVALMKQAAA